MKELDTNFYYKTLDPVINGISTTPLKMELTKITDTAKLINYYLAWIHKALFDPNYRTTTYGGPNATFSQVTLNEFGPRFEATLEDLDKYLTEVTRILGRDFQIS